MNPNQTITTQSSTQPTPATLALQHPCEGATLVEEHMYHVEWMVKTCFPRCPPALVPDLS
jgi:hypothetical protein